MAQPRGKLTLRRNWRFVLVFILLFGATYLLAYVGTWLQLAAVVAWGLAFVILARRRARETD